MRPIEPLQNVIRPSTAGFARRSADGSIHSSPAVECVPPPGGDGGGVASRPSPFTTVLFDAVDVRAALPNWATDSARPAGRVDLKRLVDALDHRYGVLRAFFFDARHGDGREVRWRREVREAGWRWQEDGDAGAGARRRPGQCAVLRRLQLACSLARTERQRIVVVSHDATLVAPLLSLLSAGVEVVVAGFIEQLSRQIYLLSDHPRTTLLDLRHDLGAVVGIERVDSWMGGPVGAAGS